MIALQKISAAPKEVIEKLKVKNFDATKIVEAILQLDTERKSIQQLLDSNLSEQNKTAKEIGTLLKNKDVVEAEKKKVKVAELKQSSENLNKKHAEVELQLQSELCKLPNLPHISVKQGKSAEDNEIVKQGGTIPTLHSNALPHWELAKKYQLFDLEAGVKLTGAGFPVYKGVGAKLQRALINYFLDCNIAAGYQEVIPPHIVNESSAYATGQLPDKDGQMYFCQEDKFYLIPTAEVPVTNLYRDYLFQPNELPIQMTAYTPCFRREAGSYGKDVRGLNRVHQFDKVEIVRFEIPENSYKALDMMVTHVESILQQLSLPYRIVRLCGGDMSFTSALTYDFEVFSAAQNRWLEVSSVSNFEDFQANRLKARYKNEDKKNIAVHTLNGSSLALPRIMAALLENNQTENSITIPAILFPYMQIHEVTSNEE